ncbi:hypothetical protein FHT86_002130 [Rhizobium sp. BK313]|uniref:hypothetical protein n=1 Tax=Rhizobium sp. BK313 TaxID=2587081 RepID=UPI0016074F2E|nr:hypothetical protein [Rhizobium sp. BK313]MBB3453874.1 hypothetical protein [Rhizobium sp. BK313]
MRIVSLVAIAAVTISLASCGALQKLNDFTINQTTVDTAMSGYDTVFLAPAKNYRALYDTNACTGSDTVTNANGLCAQKAIVQKLQDADKVVETALGEVQNQLNACTAAGQTSCTGISTAYSTLKTAISAAEQIAANNGVK